MQVRGLKHLPDMTLVYDVVAPHAGAWIETWLLQNEPYKNRSHLMQVRGLKRVQPLDVAPAAGRTSCRCVD